jgi:hypothetical protein
MSPEKEAVVLDREVNAEAAVNESAELARPAGTWVEEPKLLPPKKVETRPSPRQRFDYD